MIDHCAPFFNVLKGSKRFDWTNKCEQAFRTLKEHLKSSPLLSKPIKGERLYLYLIVSEEAVNTSLVRKEEKVQWPIYYVSKRLLDAKTRYPEQEKLALALVVESRKLRSYFHAHSIEVLTNYPLRQVLQKMEDSGRLLKWTIELGQFDLNFHHRTTIKGQALVDFIVEFTYADDAEVAGTMDNAEAAKVAKVQREKNSILVKRDADKWTIYVDGASNDTRSGADIMLITSKGYKIHLHFRFKVSNNEAKYETLIARLGLAKELQACSIQIYSDSQLVVNQVNDIYLTGGDRMAAYLEKAKGLMETFPIASFEVIPRLKNANTDALAKLASTKDRNCWMQYS